MMWKGSPTFICILVLSLRSNDAEAAAVFQNRFRDKEVLNNTDMRPSAIPDPTCKEGLASPDLQVCCAKGCGLCGDHRLCNDPGRYHEETGKLVEQCCKGAILKKAVSCNGDHPPCVLPASYKDTLDQWRESSPKRWAGQDCNKAKTKTGVSHNDAVRKGHFLTDLYIKGKTKYSDAKRIALDVTGRAINRNEKIGMAMGDASAKLAKATAVDHVKKPVTGKSNVDTWQDVLDRGKAEFKFYNEIKANAKIIIGDADIGLLNVMALKAQASKVKDVSPLQAKLDSLIIHAEKVYEAALNLWQQWEDSSKDYACGIPPQVDNTRSICKAGNTKFARKCPIICADGYDGKGSVNHLRCNKVGKFGKELSGEWNGFATCLGRLCGVPPNISHAKTVQTEIRFPHKATYVCIEGFFSPSGHQTFSMGCGVTGDFDKNYSHECKRIICGAAPRINGTHLVSGTFKYKDQVTYDCLTGHTIDGRPGGITQFHTICQATADFTQGHACHRIVCGPPPTLDHANRTWLAQRNLDHQQYGDQAKYVCQPGYSLDHRASGTKKFTIACNRDGEFSLLGSPPNTSLPQCKPVSAGIPDPIPNGKFSRREMFFGDVEIVTADTGYSLTGNPSTGLSFALTVTTDGRIAGLKTFKRVECGTPPAYPKSKTSFSAIALFDDVVQYACDRGYSLDKSIDAGSASFAIQCQADGTFSVGPPSGECLNIDDCAGHTCGPRGKCVDHLMNYTCDCDSGFQQRRDPAGHLNCGNINDCGRDACGAGKCIDLVNDYQCDCPPGYKQGTETLGNKTEKTCKPVSCGSTPTSLFATITPSDRTGQKVFYLAAPVVYQCDAGYSLDGKVGGKTSFSIECQSSGKFTFMKDCKPIVCDSVPQVTNGKAAKNSAKFSQDVVFQCDKGYSVDGTVQADTAFMVTCQASGIFTAPQECKPVACGLPPDLAHASVPSVKMHYKDSVEYKCFTGFAIDGKKDGNTKFTVKCLGDGKFSNGKVCLAKMCGELSAQDFVNAHPLNQGPVTFPHVTDVLCDDGYTTNGHRGGNKTFTVGCLENGDFSAFDPKQCKPVVCGNPPPMANATLNKTSTNKSMVFHDHVTYECRTGFTIGGMSKAPTTYDVGCLASGQFSTPTQDMMCHNVDDCQGHTCGPKGTCVDLIGPSPAYTCKCEYGYAIEVKNGEKVCGNPDDCKGQDCGVGLCKDLVGGYTCDCPAGYYVGTDNGNKTCVPVECSNSTPAVPNAELKTNIQGALHKVPVIFPMSLSYKCNTGYSVDGTPMDSRKSFLVQCGAEAVLHGLTACQKISCGTPYMLPHTKLVSPAATDSVDYQSKIEYECEKGHTIHGVTGGQTKFEAECQADGTLTHAKACMHVKCGTAPTVPNSKALVAGDLFYSEQVKYHCVTGYTLDGKAGGPHEFKRQCLETGNFSALPSSDPCKPVSLQTPTIGHAMLKEYAGNVVTTVPSRVSYPHTLIYECDSGYTLDGKGTGHKRLSGHVDQNAEILNPFPKECSPVKFTVKGIVKDSRNGQGLSGTKLTVEGTNIQATTTTGGYFTLSDMTNGTAVFVYEMSQFITTKVDITITHDIAVGGPADVSMSPVMVPGQWRAVLEWGLEPTDLDSYVKWGQNKVCWYQKDQQGADLSLKLEHDDTTSYGPETIHVAGVGKCTAGAYYCDLNYMVNDFTETGKMDQEKATVTLYTGNIVYGKWDIKDCKSSVSADKYWWSVFTLDGETGQMKWNCKQGPPSSPPQAIYMQNLHGLATNQSARVKQQFLSRPSL